MRNRAQTRRLLKRYGITYEHIVAAVQRLFPERTCTPQMVSHVLCGRARSRFVWAAIDECLPHPAAHESGAET